MSRFTRVARSRVSSVTLNPRGVTQSTLQSTFAHRIFYWHFTQIYSDKFEVLAIIYIVQKWSFDNIFLCENRGVLYVKLQSSFTHKM
ncbi:hypothetical protein [Lysinibacillus sp. NPDC047702]|uniref:hypothetical protein n=1 Tax=Lysinibacillus sp. NPDC047702 TaxID=3390573 RepID=UPI003D0751E8